MSCGEGTSIVSQTKIAASDTSSSDTYSGQGPGSNTSPQTER